MFVDKVQVQIQAGDGGDGAVSFRHEKFVDRGGPDGGDGGDGGDIVAMASNNEDTLAGFRYQKLLKAESGQPGAGSKKHGKSGNNLDIKLPVGTVVTDGDGKILGDLSDSGQSLVLARGGKGGFGNAHFVSSTRQAPRVAEKGEKGETNELIFELKMIADVGFVGLPNAGKSTLLASSSNAHPEIADYPFTTLVPNLGMVKVGDKTLLCADIPGLIEGAAEGKGLGDEFLRHIERTKVLIHLIDIYNNDVGAAYKTIHQELLDYSPDMAKKPQIIALNKIDGLDDEIIQDKINELSRVIPKNTPVFAVSAKSKQNVRELFFEAIKRAEKVNKQQVSKLKKLLPVISFKPSSDDWQINKKGEEFVVSGKKIERFASRTDFGSSFGEERFRDIMRKMGIMRELERRGIESGDVIRVGKSKIEY